MTRPEPVTPKAQRASEAVERVVRAHFFADVEAALRAFLAVNEEQGKCEDCDDVPCVGHGDAWGDAFAAARGALFRLDRERQRVAPASAESDEAASSGAAPAASPGGGTLQS